jgi:hypothetical protein
LALPSFNIEGTSFIAFFSALSVFEGESFNASNANFSVTTLLTGVLARLASFVVLIHEGSSGASLDTISFVKVAFLVAFSTGLQSGIAVLAGGIDTLLAGSVDLEEFISAGVNTVILFKHLGGFAFVASVGSFALKAVLFTV